MILILLLAACTPAIVMDERFVFVGSSRLVSSDARVYVIEDTQTGRCHAVFANGNGAAGLGQVPCAPVEPTP